MQHWAPATLLRVLHAPWHKHYTGVPKLLTFLFLNEISWNLKQRFSPPATTYPENFSPNGPVSSDEFTDSSLSYNRICHPFAIRYQKFTSLPFDNDYEDENLLPSSKNSTILQLLKWLEYFHLLLLLNLLVNYRTFGNNQKLGLLPKAEISWPSHFSRMFCPRVVPNIQQNVASV